MFPEFMWDYIRSLDIDQLNELGEWFYDVSVHSLQKYTKERKVRQRDDYV